MEERFSIKGEITYEDLEGGFWGIKGDDDSRYVPVERLPARMRIHGLRIRADVEPVHMLGTTMWGKHVRIHSIEVE